MRSVSDAVLAVGRWLLTQFGLQEVLLAVGIGCVAYGAGLIYRPAGWITPGLILIWLTRPATPPAATAVVADVLEQLQQRGR